MRRANEGRRHPAKLVAEDAESVFAMVAWDGRYRRDPAALRAPSRAGASGAARQLLSRALDAMRRAGASSRIDGMTLENRDQTMKRGNGSRTSARRRPFVPLHPLNANIAPMAIIPPSPAR